MKKNIYVSFALNLAIFLLMIFAISCELFDFHFMTDGTFLEKPDFSTFKYFTTDSNIFAGIVSGIFAIFELLVICKKKANLPKALFPLKLAGTIGVTLTMLVTVFYLAPKSDFGYFHLFKNANFFLHFFIPTLYLISFLIFERNDEISFKFTFISLIPTFVYVIFYTLNVLLHLENGKTTYDYDLYGFLDGGIGFAFFVLPFMLIFTYGISFVLWKINKKA